MGCHPPDTEIHHFLVKIKGGALRCCVSSGGALLRITLPLLVYEGSIGTGTAEAGWSVRRGRLGLGPLKDLGASVHIEVVEALLLSKVRQVLRFAPRAPSVSVSALWSAARGVVSAALPPSVCSALDGAGRAK